MVEVSFFGKAAVKKSSLNGKQMTVTGRVEAVKAPICSPNTRHWSRSDGAFSIVIGWPPRLAGCGRLGEFELEIDDCRLIGRTEWDNLDVIQNLRSNSIVSVLLAKIRTFLRLNNCCAS
jgi:hypothetical protein